MNQQTRYLLLILSVSLAVYIFYQLGQEALQNQVEPEINSTNLSNLPTSTPRPQIFRFIQEAMKKRARPAPPSQDKSG